MYSKFDKVFGLVSGIIIFVGVFISIFFNQELFAKKYIDFVSNIAPIILIILVYRYVIRYIKRKN